MQDDLLRAQRAAERCDLLLTVGTKLSVLYFGDRYPVTVAAAGPTPLFDPSNERVKA